MFTIPVTQIHSLIMKVLWYHFRVLIRTLCKTCLSGCFPADWCVSDPLWYFLFRLYKEGLCPKCCAVSQQTGYYGLWVWNLWKWAGPVWDSEISLLWVLLLLTSSALLDPPLCQSLDFFFKHTILQISVGRKQSAVPCMCISDWDNMSDWDNIEISEPMPDLCGRIGSGVLI